MISSLHRFRGYASLRRTYSQGQTIRGPLFAVKTLANPRRESYRAAIVVSRKVNKSAVVRNRIRRRLYEYLRELAPGFKSPHDIIVTVFHDTVAETPAKDLKSQLKSQLKKAGVL